MSKIMKGGVEYAFGSSSIESGSSMEVITREEYDTLVANGTVKTGVYYFITEDNGTPEWVYDESTGKITGYKTKIGGADTVFPFSKNYTITFILEIERLNGLNASLSKKQETYHMYVNNGVVTTDFEETGSYNSDGAKGWTYVRLVSISIAEN